MDFLDKFFHSFKFSEPGATFMWILLMVGIFALAVTLERYYFLWLRQKGDSETFVKRLVGRINQGDIPGARNLCSESAKHAVGEMSLRVLSIQMAGKEQLRNVIDEAILKVVPDLEKRTNYLATIGNVATLVGLMGTIYGLILSFSAVGQPGIDAVEKSALLASGIAAAMSTTFMGLMVAIPSIVLYTVLKSRTQRIIDEIDLNSLRLLNALTEHFEVKKTSS